LFQGEEQAMKDRKEPPPDTEIRQRTRYFDEYSAGRGSYSERYWVWRTQRAGEEPTRQSAIDAAWDAEGCNLAKADTSALILELMRRGWRGSIEPAEKDAS